MANNVLTTKFHTELDWTSIKAALDSSTKVDPFIIIDDTSIIENITNVISTTIWLKTVGATPTYVACRTTLTDNKSSKIMSGEDIQAKTVGISQLSPEEAYTEASNSDIPV